MRLKMFLMFVAMISFFALGFLLASLIPAAAGHPTVVFGSNCKNIVGLRIDNRFSKKHKADINKAVRNWHEASGGKICFILTDIKIARTEMFNYLADNSSTIYSGKYPWQRLVARIVHECHGTTRCAGVTVGFYNSIYPDIFIISDTNFRLLVQHEIGHVLGLGHSPNLWDTMYPTLGGIGEITKNDIEALKCLIRKGQLLRWQSKVCTYKEKKNVVKTKRENEVESKFYPFRFSHNFSRRYTFGMPQEKPMGLGVRRNLATFFSSR